MIQFAYILTIAINCLCKFDFYGVARWQAMTTVSEITISGRTNRL